MQHITVIGSCRVHTPLQKFSELGTVVLNNRGTRGYVHSLNEMVQLIQFLRGEQAIATSTLPFFPKQCLEDMQTFGPIYHDTTEKFVCEICSIKEFRINGQYMQMNLLFEALVASGMKEDYFDLCRRMNESPGVFCPFLPSKKTSENGIESLFANLEGISLTQEQVFCAAKDLLRVLKRPVSIVTHIEFEDNKDDIAVNLYTRSTGISYLREAGKCLNIPVVEPGILVNRIGKDVAMMPNDTSHYKPEAESSIGRWIFKHI